MFIAILWQLIFFVYTIDGTHVAGTAAGKTVGVAKQANIFMIKVVADNGSASNSDIISGINLALNRALANPARPAVVNMSLGGPRSRALDAAVANAIAQGLPFCVAAGNEAQDANNSSPARLSQAITVGATDINDRIASFSNFGYVPRTHLEGVHILTTLSETRWTFSLPGIASSPRRLRATTLARFFREHRWLRTFSSVVLMLTAHSWIIVHISLAFPRSLWVKPGSLRLMSYERRLLLLQLMGPFLEFHGERSIPLPSMELRAMPSCDKLCWVSAEAHLPTTLSVSNTLGSKSEHTGSTCG